MEEKNEDLYNLIQAINHLEKRIESLEDSIKRVDLVNDNIIAIISDNFEKVVHQINLFKKLKF